VTIETKVAGVEDAVLLGVGEAGDGGGAGVTDEVGVDEGPPQEKPPYRRGPVRSPWVAWTRRRPD
jgi:hypothetical protein